MKKTIKQGIIYFNNRAIKKTWCVIHPETDHIKYGFNKFSEARDYFNGKTAYVLGLRWGIGVYKKFKGKKTYYKDDFWLKQRLILVDSSKDLRRLWLTNISKASSKIIRKVTARIDKGRDYLPIVPVAIQDWAEDFINLCRDKCDKNRLYNIICLPLGLIVIASILLIVGLGLAAIYIPLLPMVLLGHYYKRLIEPYEN